MLEETRVVICYDKQRYLKVIALDEWNEDWREGLSGLLQEQIFTL